MVKQSSIPKNNGFTLLETLVAVSVLIMATVGPMTLAASSIRNASLFRNQTIAYFLAEEAVELIHNRIDMNSFSAGADWLSGFDSCVGVDGCTIDTTVDPANNIGACIGACPFIKFNDGDGLYGYSAGDDSMFRRIIRMEEISDDVEVKITVRVEWAHLGTARNASIEEHILNWR